MAAAAAGNGRAALQRVLPQTSHGITTCTNSSFHCINIHVHIGRPQFGRGLDEAPDDDTAAAPSTAALHAAAASLPCVVIRLLSTESGT